MGGHSKEQRSASSCPTVEEKAQVVVAGAVVSRICSVTTAMSSVICPGTAEAEEQAEEEAATGPDLVLPQDVEDRTHARGADRLLEADLHHQGAACPQGAVSPQTEETRNMARRLELVYNVCTAEKNIFQTIEISF